MGGLSGTIETIQGQLQKRVMHLDIAIRRSAYRIHLDDWRELSITEEELRKDHAEPILNVFRDIRRYILDNDSITLDKGFCNNRLLELARLGRGAYTSFFFEKNARQVLIEQIMGMEESEYLVAPTIYSNMALFPWEALYDTKVRNSVDTDRFWGFRYAPGRILVDNKGPFQHVGLHRLPSRMLFCIHKDLRYSYEHEWDQIKKLLNDNEKGKCSLLRIESEFLRRSDPGEPLGLRFLNNLVNSDHNMIHFACHCRRADLLVFSLLNGEKITGDEEEIKLSVHTFSEIEGEEEGEGQFKNEPLVFLNACTSGGEAYTIFNFPLVLTRAKAAAIIATACPVPDIFAAAFAKVFYDYFINKHLAIGEALRRTRLDFLNKYNNPLGLVYGLYSPSHFRVENKPILKVNQNG